MMSELLNPVMQKAFDKHNSNLTWYRNNYYNIKKEHKGEFVLIIDSDEEKVEYFKDINDIRERVKDMKNTQSIVTDYISENDSPLIV